MSSLSELFTTLQVQHLSEAGIHSIYSLITHFPYNYEDIEPFSTQAGCISGITYIANISIIHTRYKPGKRPFIHIQCTTEIGEKCSLYLFGVKRYMTNALIAGKVYQVLIKRQKDFLTIQKFAVKKNVESDHFLLGSANHAKHILPVYRKSKKLSTAKWAQIYRKLPRNQYILPLQGLIPPNTYIPQYIDLFSIHNPTVDNTGDSARKQFTALQFFLKIHSIRAIELYRNRHTAPATQKNSEYIQNIVSELEFQLSPSQTKAIEDIYTQLIVK